ncbi:MAG: DNA polymerase III subunit epsilon [Gammaproteobacteria bacterium]|nr:DNA polymerase III subunit epsilon [Gammaproteobacteria bacterium]MCY4344510.1 DNA polymerase III subunit epsilon [Gammaproteobacteria bacterium]
MRQIVLDTETTGLEPEQGHRIIEIGAVEIIDRELTGETFHTYLNPQREIDQRALEVHGINADFLAGKPLFADISEAFVAFIRDAELVIHNAPFDVAFLDRELSLLSDSAPQISELCKVTDSLALAKHNYPGRKNGLDTLCRRFNVDNSAREHHGALLDAEILAEVYLAMTGGQTALFASPQEPGIEARAWLDFDPLPASRPRLKVVQASAEELAEHERMMALVAAASG